MFGLIILAIAFLFIFYILYSVPRELIRRKYRIKQDVPVSPWKWIFKNYSKYVYRWFLLFFFVYFIFRFPIFNMSIDYIADIFTLYFLTTILNMLMAAMLFAYLSLQFTKSKWSTSRSFLKSYIAKRSNYSVHFTYYR